MEKKQLTEEQHKKLKKLQQKFSLRMAGVSAKFALTLLGANLVVCMIDAFYVHNQSFAFISAMVSTIFAFRSFRFSLMREHDRVREEVKKILEE